MALMSTSLKKKNNFLRKLIKGAFLSKSTVIVTSRPRGIEDVKGYFTVLTEIIGFSRLDIETSLLQLEAPLRTVISEYFDFNPNVKKMCYLPLHMTMIIYLASLKEDTLSGIDSETKIYTNFLYLTIDHYNKRHGQSASLLNLCLEEQAVNHSLCHLFASVSELAFNATLNMQQTFSSNEILNFPVTAETLEKLSLFYIKKENRRHGRVDVFAFSHPTFQEFMSAIYLVQLPKKEQRNLITKYGNHSILLDLVWKFFFGLVGDKGTEQTLKFLFKTFVHSSGRYRQLPTKHYAIDLYPLAYAFETGKRDQRFVDLLDYAGIVGPSNNYSIYIEIREPMDLLSFLNIEEGGNSNPNFLFMKYTLEWIYVRHLKIELQLKSTVANPDQKMCSNLWLLSNQTIEDRHLQQIFKGYCNRTKLESANVSTVVLELEYFKQQRHVINPQHLFRMLESAILSDALYVQRFRLQMVQYLSKQLHRGTRLRRIVFNIINKQNYNFETPPSNLYAEELSFINLWNHLNRYSNDRLDSSSLDFSELRRFKLQQMLLDTDLIQTCHALQSAKKLEVLDFSHNLLFTPEPLVELFKSIKQLKVLDLSDNDIKLSFIAKSFKHLRGLRELNLSGNIINQVYTFRSYPKKEAFGSHLDNLKNLRSLDLSRILYQSMQGLNPGLRDLKNLNKLNLSSCFIRDDPDLEQLASTLKFTKKLEVIDLSHNFIEYISPRVSLVLHQMKEVNLSHNALNLPISRVKLLQPSIACGSKLQSLDLSHNFLCGGDFELLAFKFNIQVFPELQFVDLTNNTLFLREEMWNVTSIDVPSQFLFSAKSVKLNSTIQTASKATRIYAACVCNDAGFKENYHKKCLQLFDLYLHQCDDQSSVSTSQKELDDIHFRVAAGYLTGITKSQNEMNSIISARAKIIKRITTVINIGKTLHDQSV